MAVRAELGLGLTQVLRLLQLLVLETPDGRARGLTLWYGVDGHLGRVRVNPRPSG